MAIMKPFLLAGVCAAVVSPSQQCVSCEGGDQTALLQSHLSRKSELSTSDHHALSFPKISQLKDPRTRKTALIELQETATHFAHMDRSGVTDLVVQLCTEAAEMLNRTLDETVLSEHKVDQLQLDSLFAKFDSYVANHAALNGTLTTGITDAQNNVTTAREMLTQCRLEQNIQCLEELNCTEWTEDNCVCPDEDHELADSSGIWCIVDEKDEQIQKRYCEDGTELADEEAHRTVAWRDATGTLFTSYSGALDAALALSQTCETVRENCTNISSQAITKSTECNSLEQDFQVASCDFRRIFLNDIEAYDASYEINKNNMANGEIDIRLREADRKVEWEVLERVICLLMSLTNNETDDNGNVEHGLLNESDSQNQIQDCWDMFVDVTHLDIVYYQPPLQLGWPDLPPKPCTAEFHENQSLGEPISCDVANRADELFQGTSYHCFCNIEGTNISNSQYVSNFHMSDVLGNADMTVDANTWSLFSSEGVDPLCTGSLSDLIDSDRLSGLSALVPSEDDTDQATISKFAFAYPHDPPLAFCQDAYTTGLSLKQWFCCKGGPVFQDANNAVLSAYEFLPYYSTRPTNGDSDSMGHVLDVEMQARADASEVLCDALGCTLVDVPIAFQYGLGPETRQMCWTTSPEQGCLEGCLAFKVDTGGCFISRLVDGIYDEPIVQ